MASAEIELFLESVKSKSVNTIKSYKSQYNKLLKLVVTDAVHQNSQKTLMKLASEQVNSNSIQAMLNIGILIRRLYDLPVENMLAFRESNKKQLIADVKVSNQYLSALPTLKELQDFTQHLYDSKEYLDYAINWLLLEYNVRNADLAIELITRRRDANEPAKNYLWVSPKKITYIRNAYKTSDTYGTKEHIITDKNFMLAIKYLLKCQNKKDTNKTCFFPTTEQAGYVVMKATYQKLGSSVYFKIAVDTHRDNLQKIKEMGINRGTATDTIIESYDLENL